jgi:sugar transferase EpsL
MYTIVKNIVDRSVAALILLLMSPITLVVAVLIAFDMGRPVLFTQPRPGQAGKVFRLYKFRSMSSATDVYGQLLPDAQRLTKLGQVLRKTSLDELPQLWNVLRGDMSLVGPRPLLVSYLDRYTPEQARRHEVKPGITGWAQVNGRNALSWEEKFRLDVWYVDHQCFALDLKILWRTVFKVAKSEGISQNATQVTMEEFLGNLQSKS